MIRGGFGREQPSRACGGLALTHQPLAGAGWVPTPLGSAGGGRRHTGPPPLRAKVPGDGEDIPGGGPQRNQGLRPTAGIKHLCELPAGGMWLGPLCDPQCRPTVQGCPGSPSQGEDKMGSCQGRWGAGSPRAASVEGWRPSQLPPLSPQPPEVAMGSGGGQESSGGSGSRPPCSAQPAPPFLPCFLRELGRGPLGRLRLHSLYQSGKKKVSPAGGGQARLLRAPHLLGTPRPPAAQLFIVAETCCAALDWGNQGGRGACSGPSRDSELHVGSRIVQGAGSPAPAQPRAPGGVFLASPQEPTSAPTARQMTPDLGWTPIP